MKISVSNWIFGDEPLVASLDRLKRFGCDGIELVGEADLYDPTKVSRLCSERELEVFSVLCMATGTRDLAHPDPEIRHGAISYVRRCLELAHAVGARTVSTILTAVSRTAPVGAPSAEAEWQAGVALEWRHALDSVRLLAQHAAQLQLTLAIEPINRYETYLLRTAAQAREFVAQVGSEAVSIQLDTFHLNLEEDDPAQAIRQTGSLLSNLHLADSNRRTPGDGRLDWPAILTALHEIGYTGPLTLEPVPAESNLFLAVRMSGYAALRDRDIEVGAAYLRRQLARLASGAA